MPESTEIGLSSEKVADKQLIHQVLVQPLVATSKADFAKGAYADRLQESVWDWVAGHQPAPTGVLILRYSFSEEPPVAPGSDDWLTQLWEDKSASGAAVAGPIEVSWEGLIVEESVWRRIKPHAADLLRIANNETIDSFRRLIQQEHEKDQRIRQLAVDFNELKAPDVREFLHRVDGEQKIELARLLADSFSFADVTVQEFPRTVRPLLETVAREVLRRHLKEWTEKHPPAIWSSDKETSANEMKAFKDAFNDALDACQAALECPECKKPARLDYWSTRNRLFFLHPDSAKHLRRKEFPVLRLIGKPKHASIKQALDSQGESPETDFGNEGEP